MKPQKIVIVKTGNSFPSIIPVLGNFEDWIARELGQDPQEIQVINVEQHQPLPRLDAVKGVVIAGSHAMVTQNLDWSLELEAWIPKLIQKKVPLLGICYGQAIEASGQDPSQVLDQVVETPVAAMVLNRFGTLASV